MFLYQFPLCTLHCALSSLKLIVMLVIVFICQKTLSLNETVRSMVQGSCQYTSSPYTQSQHMENTFHYLILSYFIAYFTSITNIKLTLAMDMFFLDYIRNQYNFDISHWFVILFLNIYFKYRCSLEIDELKLLLRSYH